MAASSSSSSLPASSSGPVYGTITVPLTTVFTPPAWCASRQYTYDRLRHGTSYFTHNWRIAGSSSECYPPLFPAFKTGSSWGIYSPGVCPSGWNGTPFGPSATPSVSWTFCCPDGMTLPKSDRNTCLSSVTTPTILSVSNGEYTEKSDVMIGEWPVWIAWATKDLDVFTPASAPLHINTAPAATRPRPKIPEQTADSAEPGISSAVEAGIGTGIAIVILVVIALMVALYMRRKRARKLQHTVEDRTALQNPALDKYGMFEVPTSHEPWRDKGGAGHASYEMMALAEPVEKDSSALPTPELDSNWHGYELERRIL